MLDTCLRWGLRPHYASGRRVNSRIRLVGKRVVLPASRVEPYRYPISIVDKLWCPFNNISMVYFFEQSLDTELVCESLSELIALYPFLGGTIRGYHLAAYVACDNSGVEVTEAETTYTVQDINYHSGALDRQSALLPIAFGAGEPWDPIVQCFGRAPVLRLRITKLAGGGTALGLAASHTVMDARSVMKVMELWAKEARRLQSEGGRAKKDQEEDDEEEEGEPLTPPALALRQHCTGVSGAGGGSGSSYKEPLLSASVLDAIAEEARTRVPHYTLVMGLTDLVNSVTQTLGLWYLYFWGGMESQTLFFSDDFLAELKTKVMAEIKQKDATASGAGAVSGEDGKAAKPAFVSTNDVLSAFIWKSIQGLPVRRQRPGLSRLHMVVDVRDSVVKKKAGSDFFFGNAVLAVAAQNSSAADASLSELSQSIRQAIQSMTPRRAEDIMGSWKRKEDPPAQLGITTGPNGIDWDLSRDVIFSCFSPLSTDTDLGRGAAFLYHLDLVPALNMYTHTHRGCDRHGDQQRQGLYVCVTAPPDLIRELAVQQRAFLPAPPQPPDLATAAASSQVGLVGSKAAA